MATVDCGLSPHILSAIQESWGFAVSRFVTGRQLSLVQETSCTLYRSEMEHAEATSRNETRALPENNFVIARLVISFSARILCHIISLVLKSLCFYWFMR